MIERQTLTLTLSLTLTLYLTLTLTPAGVFSDTPKPQRRRFIRPYKPQSCT